MPAKAKVKVKGGGSPAPPIIESISGVNVKGQTFGDKLGPATMIIGPNFSGKTARLAAIQLAFLGYLPGPKPKKTGADIMSLSSGSSMSCGVTCGGHTWSRHWNRVGDSVKGTLDGEPMAVPPVLMDTAVYLSLSADKKTESSANFWRRA